MSETMSPSFEPEAINSEKGPQPFGVDAFTWKSIIEIDAENGKPTNTGTIIKDTNLTDSRNDD